MPETPFSTIHNLAFEMAPWERSDEWLRFRVGTCHGLWRSTDASYDILAIQNDEPGNGHFQDLMQWFEASCIRDDKLLRIMEIWNERLLQHLVYKRHFVAVNADCIKSFKNKICP